MTHRANGKKHADDVQHGTTDSRFLLKWVFNGFIVAKETPLKWFRVQIQKQYCDANWNRKYDISIKT